jgi:hypothetical protein
MAQKKRIGIVSYNASHGLVWQRLHLNLRHLKDEYEFVCFDVANLRHADAFYLDAIVMSQPWSNAYLSLIERCRLHYRIPVIVDVDDLVSELPADHPDFVSFKANVLPQIIQASTAVVYSTKYLQGRLGHLNKRHAIVPNSICAKTYAGYEPKNKPYKNAFIVGWTGGQSHRADQYFTFLPGLQRFLREHSDAKAYFHVLCPDALLKEFGSQIIYEPTPCEYLDYYSVAASYPFDVCLVGLTDTNFNHAKSDLKLLEMAPNKIPVIASPRADFIQHKDKSVMLYADDASTNDYCSWYQQLCYAYENRDGALKEMGQKAFDYVMSERTSDKTADLWREILAKYV